MKNRVKKVLMLTGILCVIGITLCACQGTKEVPNEDQQQDGSSETNSEDDAADDTLNQEPDTENADKMNNGSPEDDAADDTLNQEPDTENADKMNNGSPEDDAADDTLNQEPDIENAGKTNNGSQSEANGGEINTADPNLEGTIKEIQEKQLTVVESITEESENGGDIMVGPGSGDDSEFNKVTVTYDDNTVFVIKNIYDGGARSETENGTSSDLATGQMVEIWGTSAADGLQATQICIVKVVSD